MPKIEITGLSEALAVFEELADEIGDKKATSKILIPAARESMKPVLSQARMFAPKDTGDLARTLWIEARRPNARDKKSKYINSNDTVIAVVSTKPFPKKKRQQFYEANKGLWDTDKKAYKKKFKEYAYSINFPYDARAIAQEFGTARTPAHPFMRRALESEYQNVAKSLGDIIGRRIEAFKAKNIK